MAVETQCLELDFWNGLMGRDLPAAQLKALQPIIVEDGRFLRPGGHLPRA